MLKSAVSKTIKLPGNHEKRTQILEQLSLLDTSGQAWTPYQVNVLICHHMHFWCSARTRIQALCPRKTQELEYAARDFLDIITNTCIR
jgi:hypothetical protein